MAVNGLNSPYSGMMASQARQNVTANNVANVNTPGYRPQTPAAQPARQQPAAGPAYINSVGQGNAAQPTASAYAPPRPAAAPAASPAAMPAPAPMPPAQSTAAPTAMTQSAPTTAAPRMSNVDMITETANRMNTRNAYGANAAAAQGMNGMMQTLMDMVG